MRKTKEDKEEEEEKRVISRVKVEGKHKLNEGMDSEGRLEEEEEEVTLSASLITFRRHEPTTHKRGRERRGMKRNKKDKI